VLIRSSFWLAVAFLVIGPRVDIVTSLSDLSRGATQGAQELVQKQTDISTCKSVNCVGTKVMISAGMQAVTDLATSATRGKISETLVSNSSAQVIFPQPRPRIARAS